MNGSGDDSNVVLAFYSRYAISKVLAVVNKNKWEFRKSASWLIVIACFLSSFFRNRELDLLFCSLLAPLLRQSKWCDHAKAGIERGSNLNSFNWLYPLGKKKSVEIANYVQFWVFMVLKAQCARRHVSEIWELSDVSEVDWKCRKVGRGMHFSVRWKWWALLVIDGDDKSEPHSYLLLLT